jgi:hypothetical protein
MKLAALGCVGLLAALRPSPAEACSCDRLSVGTVIEKTAPTNTHVLLWSPNDVHKKAPVFTLREAGGTRAIAIDRHDVKASAFTIIALVPKQALRAKATYEVFDNTGYRVLELTTTAGKDTKAPTWKGIQRASYVKQPGQCCVCNTGTPYVTVDVGAVSDDHGASTVVFGVWTAGADGKIDYKRPPTTFVQPWQTELSLGHPSTCSVNNFDLPIGKRLRIGLRPVDLAGNVGTASEIELDLSKKPKPIAD